MSYHIEAIELFVRETLPSRMRFQFGKEAGRDDQPADLVSALGHVRMVVRDDAGNETFGCSGDRLSVRWLDKRPGRDKALKLRELVTLLNTARSVYLAEPRFANPFTKWKSCHAEILQAGETQGQEQLTSAFASSLMERAVVDAVCRLAGEPVFQMVKQDRLGFQPATIHPQLADLRFPQTIPERPLTEFYVRHTVGLADPIAGSDLPDEQRVRDGLPETLEEYVAADGVRHFKVKLSGEPAHDFERLERIWSVVVHSEQPVITLDANESYSDPNRLVRLVDQLEEQLTGLFQHVEYIEQPLDRRATFDRSTSRAIHELSERKPLLIDEADGTLDAYEQARDIGYQGVSHKNCKGFFKSLTNHALVVHRALQGEQAFMSAEDLQNLPIVPLHQDFASLGILGLEHCERNGHHYHRGLSMLSPADKERAARNHPDLYVERGGEWFLDIRGGRVECASLQCPGFGVHDEPDWRSMQKLDDWIQQRYPA